MSKPAILCLDVSLCNTGWAVVNPVTGTGIETLVACGCITTAPDKREKSKTVGDIQRVEEIAQPLRDIIAQCSPRLIVGELPYGAQSASAAKAMGVCIGVLGVIRAFTGIPCHWVTPQSSKKALCGRMDASKEDVQKTVAILWPEITEQKKAHREHIADALAAVVVARKSDLYRMVAQVRSEDAA